MRKYGEYFASFPPIQAGRKRTAPLMSRDGRADFKSDYPKIRSISI
jgi:hypothetical protein